jgi:hypothetical protein
MNAADVIDVTRLGVTFRASRRTVAHLDWTISLLALAYPKATLRIIQSPYNTGVKASAGTHDYDACFDVEIVGLDWLRAQTFLRKCGWAAWVRQPPLFTWHIHMISLGYPGQVGVYVPGQVADYYAHRDGLAGHRTDPTWHPKDIDSTVFDFDEWEREMEEAMPFTDWPQKDQDALVQAVTDKILNTELGNGSTVRNNIRKAGDTKALAKEIAAEVKALP